MRKDFVRRIAVLTVALLIVAVSYIVGSSRAYAPPPACQINPCRNLFYYNIANSDADNVAYCLAVSDGMGNLQSTLSGWVQCYSPTANADGNTLFFSYTGVLLKYTSSSPACTTAATKVREMNGPTGAGKIVQAPWNFQLCYNK
jgi:hypothetical protein